MATKKADTANAEIGPVVAESPKTKGQMLESIGAAQLKVRECQDALDIARFNLDEQIRLHNLAPE